MSRNRGVNPNDTTTLQLSDGDWIEVRKRLTSGEDRLMQRLTAKGYQKSESTDGGDAEWRIDYDVTKYAPVRIASYVTSWSIRNFKGEPIPLPANYSLEKRVQIVESLDEDTVGEMDDAILEHIRTQKEEREQEKKARAGGSIAPASEATSQSVAT
jgi:hypothetical protein